MRIAFVLFLYAFELLPANVESRSVSALRPEVRSPQNNQHIGGPDDPQCEKDRPCFKIRAEGWVPSDRFPFFIVAPLNVGAQMWVQTPIHGVNTDGTFSGLVQLGEAQNGAHQSFKIFVFACSSADRFSEGDQLSSFPEDCQISPPVEVFRER